MEKKKNLLWYLLFFVDKFVSNVKYPTIPAPPQHECPFSETVERNPKTRKSPVAVSLENQEKHTDTSLCRSRRQLIIEEAVFAKGTQTRESGAERWPGRRGGDRPRGTAFPQFTNTPLIFAKSHQFVYAFLFFSFQSFRQCWPAEPMFGQFWQCQWKWKWKKHFSSAKFAIIVNLFTVLQNKMF